MKIYYVLVVMILFFSLQLISAEDYPKLQPFVNDFAGLMTSEQISNLNSICALIETNSTYEVVIVTSKSTNGEGRVLYAANLGEGSGVGKSETDNGLVVLWSQENEKGLAIATGRGAGSVFNDAKVSRILREHRHFFDDGQYYEGFKAILADIQKELQVSSSEPINNTNTEGDSDTFTNLIIFCAVLLFIIFIIFKITGYDGIGVSFAGAALGGFGGGGGGFSFGGGSFGGGGGAG